MIPPLKNQYKVKLLQQASIRCHCEAVGRGNLLVLRLYRHIVPGDRHAPLGLAMTG